jgi:hypothetical protein
MEEIDGLIFFTSKIQILAVKIHHGAEEFRGSSAGIASHAIVADGYDSVV